MSAMPFAGFRMARRSQGFPTNTMRTSLLRLCTRRCLGWVPPPSTSGMRCGNLFVRAVPVSSSRRFSSSAHPVSVSHTGREGWGNCSKCRQRLLRLPVGLPALLWMDRSVAVCRWSGTYSPQLPLNLSSEAAFRWPEAVIRFGRSESILTK